MATNETRLARLAQTPTAGNAEDNASKGKQINATVIVRHLVQHIARGDYKPGDRIREQEIAQSFGTSRSPVREAFRILEAKGVLTFEPMRGVTVRAVTPDEARERVDISAVLFGLAARYAARKATPDDARKVREAAEGLVDMSAQDIEAKYFFFETLNTGYVLLQASRTHRIADEVLDSRLGAPDLIGPACFETRQARLRVAGLWIELADAVGRGDAPRAEQIAIDIYQVAARYALEGQSGPGKEDAP